MGFKRFLCAAISLVMAIAVVPSAAIAEEVSSAVHEKSMMKLLDDAWQVLDKVEAEAIASGADSKTVTHAVYKAALQLNLVDEGSINSLTSKSFFFKVNGMECCYDYVARNVKFVSTVDNQMIKLLSDSFKEGPNNLNVLLVGPYYGEDSSFTNQYRDEAAHISEATGGETVELVYHAATGPAIAREAANAGVVIYDSHGTASGTSSYLCLTTNEGITSTDYTNGWAVSSGSAAFIDGRYIENHIDGELPNTMFWMAICEGMKKSGKGTTGYALLRAGAGCVYGYSQSVSFSGDYLYEAHFWNRMVEDGATVAEAYNSMTETYGNWDPAHSSSYGAAWPIIMSPVDEFPTNPDSHQTVNCDWTLMGGDLEPVELEDYQLSAQSVEVNRTETVEVSFIRVPDNANNYSLVWGSEDESIATVAGNNRKAVILGVNEGSTRIYCDVYAGEELMGRAYCEVNVLHYPSIDEALNVEGGNLEFTSPTASYPWKVAFIGDRIAAKSSNDGFDKTTSTLRLVLDMKKDESIAFDWKVSSEANYDKLGFYVNDSQQGSLLSGNMDWRNVTYTAANDGTYTFEWRYVKDVSVADGDDCGYVDNVVYNRLYIPGDIDNDGVVSSVDALMALRASMGVIELTADEITRADVNNDGVVDMSDALWILRNSIGM